MLQCERKQVPTLQRPILTDITLSHTLSHMQSVVIEINSNYVCSEFSLLCYILKEWTYFNPAAF